nr:BLUF domain-containing protein [Cognatishimia sp. F0-27]
MHQLIYWSQPFGYDDAILAGILLDARRMNARADVSGALVCRQDVYLQLLEGPADTVLETYARIRRDDRHTNPTILTSRAVSARLFGDWSMLHDPATSWMWSPEEIADGALERASATEAIAAFEALGAKVATSAPTCPR